MEAQTYKFEPTSYLSPLYENASCAITKGNDTYYRPINSINWDTNEITTMCAKDADIQSEKTEQKRGSYQSWPLNAYLHTFYKNERAVQCDDGQNPILSLKWENVSGKYEPVYQCPADDSLRFAKTKEYTYVDTDLSNFDYNDSNDVNNKRFVNQTWLNKNNHIFYCPADWYLGKIQGGQQGFNNNYHNVYKWTCGTIYNDYDNGDASFKWRYFNDNGSLCMQIITNIKIMVDESDQTVHDYINENGQYIDFIFVYNLMTNTMTINAKTSNSDTYEDVTAECYVRNTENTIECNYPLTEISIVQFTFDKSTEDVVDLYESGTTITDLPMYFTNMTMVQDTTLPKIYSVTWLAGEGAECNGTKLYTKTFVEGDKIVHPSCNRLGFSATQFVESGNSNNVIIAGSPVTRRMYIAPVFTPVQYTIKFNNDTSDFEYIQCDGTFSTTASLNEIIAASKIPTCKGEGVTFNGWYDADNRKAGVKGVTGDVFYNPSVNYPDYKLIFTVPQHVTCRTECNARTINRRNPIGALPTPFKDNYTFKGWYYDSAFTKPVHSTDKLVKDTTVYPKFAETIWTVNFIAPKGAIISPVSVLEANNAKTTGVNPIATLANHTFKGFYQISQDDTLSTTKWTARTPVYKNMVFTAVFEDSKGNKVYKKYSEAIGELKDTVDNDTTGYIPDNNVNNTTSNTDVTPSNANNNATSNTDVTPSNTDVTPSNTDVTPSNTVATFCPADAGFPQTNVGDTASIACPTGSGKRTRTCNANGVWDNEDITGCIEKSEESTESTNTLLYIIIGVVIVVIIVIMMFMSKRSVVVQAPNIVGSA